MRIVSKARNLLAYFGERFDIRTLSPLTMSRSMWRNEMLVAFGTEEDSFLNR